MTTTPDHLNLTKTQVDQAIAGMEPSRSRVLSCALVVHRAVTHQRTRDSARAIARHHLYLAGGARIAARRYWDARTPARHDRMVRIHEAAGNPDEVRYWTEQGAAFRKDRHERRMDALQAAPHIARSIGIYTAIGIGGLIALGIVLAIATGNQADVGAPIRAAIATIRALAWFATEAWEPVLIGAPIVALAALWNLGRRQQAAPAWALPAASRGQDPITPSIVIKAMQDLGVGPLRSAILAMEDGGSGMLSPIVIAGCGIELDVHLPSGVSTDQIQARRKRLAENLRRHEHELFITVAKSARTVHLWVADPGALDEPIGPSPLVTDTTIRADYRTGRAPWGQDLRGDAARISLYQRHLLVTGLSNQGKSVAVRSLALWLALDPQVQFRIADLKGFGDWAIFDGIADVLIQGPADEHVVAATEMLESGVAEMENRLAAGAGHGFPPLVLIVDEAQVAFMCPIKDEQKRPYGGTKATSRYFMAARKIHNQGRAVNITLWQGTQDPTDQNLPKLVREGAHIRASLVVGTEAQAKMALGDKAVDGGAAPHKLRQGLDKGTLVVAGDGVELPPGDASITIRTHYIDDQHAAVVAERAKRLRKRVTTANAAAKPAPDVDHLADIAAAIAGRQRARTQEVLHALAEQRPAVYREWTFADLTGVLDGYGCPPHKSEGVMVVDRSRVLTALANRDQRPGEAT